MPSMVGVVADSYNKPASGGAWSPISLGSVLEAWFDATDASTFSYSTGNDPGNPGSKYVSQWRDLSGKANHANGNANAGYHPKRSVTINGLTAIDFSTGYIGILKGLGITTYLGNETKPSSYFLVVRIPASYTNGASMIGANTAGLSFRVLTTGAIDLLVPAIAGVGATSAGVISATGTYLLACTYSAAGVYTMRKNGAQVATGTNNLTPNSSVQMGLGSATDTDSNSLGAYIGEVVICNDVISGTNLSNLETYLMNKWLLISPTQIAGLVGWWDASDTASITSSAGAVSQWNDKSGNTRHVTQATGANQPSTGMATINGRNSITFDGTTDRLDSAVTQLISTVDGTWTAFVACKPTTGAGVRVVFDHDLGTTTVLGARQATFLKLSNTTAQIVGYDSSTPVAFTDSAASLFTANVTNVFSSTRRAADLEVFLNGISAAATATTGTPNSAASTRAFRIGGNNAASPTQFFQGDLAEIIVYNTALSTADRIAVENYLQYKWITGPYNFTPTQLTGLQAWYDASDTASITSSANAVSQLNDKSTNARHATQATAGNKPMTGTANINGRNVLTFDGTDDYLQSSVFTVAQPLTIFVVTDIGADSTQAWFSGNGASTPQCYYGIGGQSHFYCGTALAGMTTPLGQAVWCYYGNGASSAIYKNGTLLVAGDAGTFGISNGVLIGAPRDKFAGWFGQGSIGEAIVYNTVLSTTDRQNVEGYLKNKWGIA